MSDLFVISNDTKTKELHPIGWIIVEPPFDPNLLLNTEFVTEKITAFTDRSILDNKDKVTTRQSPNRVLLSFPSDLDTEIREMMRQVAFGAVYETNITKIDVPLLLLFIYRRQFWDWEILCEVYVDKVVGE